MFLIRWRYAHLIERSFNILMASLRKFMGFRVLELFLTHPSLEIHLRNWAAHESPLSGWWRIQGPSGTSRVPGIQSQEAFASWTTSSSLKPTNVLRFSTFVSSRHISTTSNILFMASSTVSPQEWHPLKSGQLTMYRPSSSISLRIGKCSFSMIGSTYLVLRAAA